MIDRSCKDRNDNRLWHRVADVKPKQFRVDCIASRFVEERKWNEQELRYKDFPVIEVRESKKESKERDERRDKREKREKEANKECK